VIRIFVCVLVTLSLTPALSAQSPVYFRSDQGLAADRARLPDNFDDGARLVWRRPLDPGHSTPCVTPEQIIVTTFRAADKELATVALHRQDGDVRWRRVAPAQEIEPFHATGSPASSSPAWNGSHVFSFFGSCGLLCYDAAGNLQWQTALGKFQDEFGAASSPVLVDNLVVLNEDHDLNSFLVAIEQETGKIAWRTPREGFTRSYSTPIVFDNGGERELVVAGALQLTGYRVKDGTRRWWVNGLSRIVDCTPVIADGSIFVASWTPGGDPEARLSMEPFEEALRNYDRNQDRRVERSELPATGPVLERFFRIDLNQDQKLDQDEWEKHARVFDLAQNAALRIQPTGQGDLTATGVRWSYQRGLPTVPSSVVYDNILYMVKDSGIVTSVDATSGLPLKQGRATGRGNYYASLVAGDGKIYLCSEAGVVTVLKAGSQWEVLSAHDFGERIMATPVIRDAHLYIRTEAALYCFVRS
jgi:outer membrane protein assembly factor BamB